MCRAMCRPGVLVQHTWRVGAPVPTLLAGFTLSALGFALFALGFTLFVMHWHGVGIDPCTEGIDPGEFCEGQSEIAS